MLDALQYEFVRNALYAGLLASMACGIIGTLVVINRIVFISGGVAHAAYGGIGLAFYTGWAILPCTLAFSVLMASIMALVTAKNKQRADTVIGVIWAIGMATGIIFLDLSPGYSVDLMSYLFGSLMAVPSSELWLMVLLDLIILGVVLFFFKEFLAMSYDEEFAMTRGIAVKFLYFLLLVLIGISVVLIMRVVGLILLIALIAIPPYIAEGYSRSLAMMMVISTVLSAVFTVSGLCISYVFDLSSGAAIILVAGIFFFLSILFERFRMKPKFA